MLYETPAYCLEKISFVRELFNISSIHSLFIFLKTLKNWYFEYVFYTYIYISDVAIGIVLVKVQDSQDMILGRLTL